MNENKIGWFFSKLIFIFTVSGLAYGIKSELKMFEDFGFWAIVMCITVIEVVINRFKENK